MLNNGVSRFRDESPDSSVPVDRFFVLLVKFFGINRNRELDIRPVVPPPHRS